MEKYIDIANIFTWVTDDKVEQFKAAHATPSTTFLDPYYHKVVFLGTTGEIVTHAKIFGANVSVIINELWAAIRNNAAAIEINAEQINQLSASMLDLEERVENTENNLQLLTDKLEWDDNKK